jgi:nucleotide-binding universal stress UspA family protein
MKQIIVATDFSVPAEHAMLYAARLAQKTGSALVLLHVFQVPVSMSEVPVLMVSVDELKHNADMGLKRASDHVLQLFPGLRVETEARMGDITSELNDLCEGKEVFAIVTGKHGASGLERLFFGSTSLSVVRHTRLPVIVVPENATTKEPKTIAFAVDEQIEILPEQKIKTLVQDLGAVLHIIHVQPEKSGSKELKPSIEGLNTIYQTIRDDDFLHGIQTYLQQYSIDMLMVLPHKHSFFERLGSRSHTEELLRKIAIPVVCLTE